MTTLHYAGQPGTGYGWGTCNTHLRAELANLFTLTNGGADVCFMPLADHDLNPATPARGKVNFGYCFFEFELGPNAAENAAKFDTVFAGSTWCLDRLAERGIHNTALLIQGVDGDVFKPQPRRAKDSQFRIFSGGKFEYRKGQDLVIAAFREFSAKHPEAHLVCSWFNPWPQLIGSMCASDAIKMPVSHTNDLPSSLQFHLYQMLFTVNGIDSDRVTILPQLSHADLAREMANTDAGLFPNRCEGGTNLVLMEYAAQGRPVIANVQTGHADVAAAVRHIIPATVDPATSWAVQSVADIVAQMEVALHSHTFPQPPAPRWPWADAAQIVAQKYLSRVD